MTFSSIDDVVQHWIIDASSYVARVGSCSRQAKYSLASHRRAIAVIALTAVGSLFTLPFLLALVGVPLVFGLIALLVQRVTDGDQV
jgi:hypothetical protein